MKAIQQKYKRARPYLKNGDVILFQGTGMLAETIQYFTGGRWNHVGIIWVALNHRVFIIDSNAPGVHPDFLSTRINAYHDFEIVRFGRTIEAKETALCYIMDKADEDNIKYNFLRLLRIAIRDSFHVDLKWMDQKGRDICSQFVQIYCQQLNVVSLENIPLITPMDFDRKLDWNEGRILFRN